MLVEVEGGFFGWDEVSDLEEQTCERFGSHCGRVIERGGLSIDEKSSLPRIDSLKEKLFMGINKINPITQGIDSSLLLARSSNDNQVDGKVQIEVDIVFGGSDGSQGSLGLSGSVIDKKGNNLNLDLDYNTGTQETHLGLSAGKKFSSKDCPTSSDTKNSKTIKK